MMDFQELWDWVELPARMDPRESRVCPAPLAPPDPWDLLALLERMAPKVPQDPTDVQEDQDAEGPAVSRESREERGRLADLDLRVTTAPRVHQETQGCRDFLELQVCQAMTDVPEIQDKMVPLENLASLVHLVSKEARESLAPRDHLGPQGRGDLLALRERSDQRAPQEIWDTEGTPDPRELWEPQERGEEQDGTGPEEHEDLWEMQEVMDSLDPRATLEDLAMLAPLDPVDSNLAEVTPAPADHQERLEVREDLDAAATLAPPDLTDPWDLMEFPERVEGPEVSGVLEPLEILDHADTPGRLALLAVMVVLALTERRELKEKLAPLEPLATLACLAWLVL